VADTVLEARGLAKRYGERVAVDGISFAVGRGEILGFLGPNGAGKTTTVSLVAGLLRPDSGEVWLAGERVLRDDDPLKRRLGLVPQDLALHEPLSALQNLEFFGGLQGLSRSRLRSACEAALAFVELADRARDRVASFSGGMKRRLNLAAGILHDPEVLLLDEPTVGVDPQSRSFIFENLEALRARGKAILYTTHYMEEVERLCERVVIVDHGRVVADDRVEELRRRAGGAGRLEVELAAPAATGWPAEIAALPGVSGAEISGARVMVRLDDPGRGSAAVLAFLSARGAAVEALRTERPSLETVFLALTGRSLRDS
jgi:ABC-2 type transport system ATP-binding protein